MFDLKIDILIHEPEFMWLIKSTEFCYRKDISDDDREITVLNTLIRNYTVPYGASIRFKDGMTRKEKELAAYRLHLAYNRLMSKYNKQKFSKQRRLFEEYEKEAKKAQQ